MLYSIIPGFQYVDENGNTYGVRKNRNRPQMEVQMADSASVDAFSRLRVSNTEGIFDFKNIYGLNDESFQTISSGAGSSSAFLPNESSQLLTVGTGATDYVIRQSFRYFPYTPGSSQMIIMTGVLGAGIANVTRRIGYFDDQNGLFFQLAGSTLSVALRSFTSGVAVDTVIPQSSWNIDKLDGTGVSGITLDPSKSQIFIIDFQWLGVGRVRFGFDIGGNIEYFHEILNANVLDKVYMTTPTLPLRYEIRNTAASVGGTMKAICSSVSTEGGGLMFGEEFVASSGINKVAVVARRPIFALRLKSTLGGKPNRRTIKFLSASALTTGNDAFIEIVHGQSPSGITATWQSASDDSGAEYSTNISAITFGSSRIYKSFYSPTAAGKAATDVLIAQTTNEHSFLANDYAGTTSMYFVIYATAFSGTANVASMISWGELE